MAAFPQEVALRVCPYRRVVTLSALTATLLVAALLLPLDAAHAITRDGVLARAQSVINSPVPYSQSKYVGGWRNDCSGYVSWVWGTGSNLYTTRNLSSISQRIAPAQLQPGDVLLKYDSHVRLFYSWADDAHTTYVAYEQTPNETWSSVKTLATDIADGYVPYRYNKITDNPAAWNLVRNSTFNAWNKGRTKQSPRDAWSLIVPDWWDYNQSANAVGAGYQVRGDQFSSAPWALGLVNLSSSPANLVEARHWSLVEPDKTYKFSALVGTTSKPSAVTLAVQVYNSSGTMIRDFRTTGDACGIGATGLKPMEVTALMPPGATYASPVLGFAGATNPAGGAGGTMVFDDPAFYVTSPLPVYRFYNSKTGAHFYTASGVERDTVANASSSAFAYEGPAYAVVTTGANSAPLHRFFNKTNGTHFYTVSQQEYENVRATLSSTYTYDGPAYNVSATPVQGSTTVYRFFNTKNGSHFYTVSETERDMVKSKLSAIYSYEGPAFYLAP